MFTEPLSPLGRHRGDDDDDAAVDVFFSHRPSVVARSSDAADGADAHRGIASDGPPSRSRRRARASHASRATNACAARAMKERKKLGKSSLE
jgi:hypothetical protein